jgi:hypothetical protein
LNQKDLEDIKNLNVKLHRIIQEGGGDGSGTKNLMQLYQLILLERIDSSLSELALQAELQRK